MDTAKRFGRRLGAFRALQTLGLAAVLGCAAMTFAAQPSTPAAATPARLDALTGAPKQDNGRFLQMHESFRHRAKEGPIGLLFLGDSITEGWHNAPQVWKRHYGRYQPANFGISGDQTQHMIWRIENGIAPKVVVLMLGTNNAGWNTGPEIAAADEKIVRLIRAKLPQAKILLLAIFPRGPRKNGDGSLDDGVDKMAQINEANARLAKLDDGHAVRFLDINAKFYGSDGKIPASVMSDQLHPSIEGYQIWADAMQPLLDEMMGEKK